MGDRGLVFTWPSCPSILVEVEGSTSMLLLVDLLRLLLLLVLVLIPRLLRASKISETKTMEFFVIDYTIYTLVLYTLHLRQTLPSDSAFLLFSPWEGDHKPCFAYVV